MARLYFVLCFVLAFFSFHLSVSAQTTAFSYQGFIKQSSAPANGNFDLQFSVFDDLLAGTQQGSVVSLPAVPVANGVFAVSLDFGGGIFTGPPRFLQVAVRPAGSPDPHTPLAPRTQIISAPYAMKSLAADSANVAATAGNALQLGGIPASQYLQTASAPITGDIHFTGRMLLAPSTNIVKTGPTPTPPATLYAINTEPGIINPSLTNLPPAAVRGDATSTINSTVGVIGQSNGENGAGVVGIGRATGMVAIHTGTTGEGEGISGETFSPDATALNLNMPTGGTGNLISASSGSKAVGFDNKFNVRSNGDVDINGSIALVGNQNINGNLSVVGTSGSINANSVTSNSGAIGTINANTIFANNLSVSGNKNNIVTLKDGRTVLFYANESPENWFEDFGTVKLRNGRAVVKIDPTFAEATNTAINYKVFLTPNGNARGLYVVRKNATTFEVRENGRGRSNTSFDYRIVAKRRGYENVRFGPSNK